MRDESNRDDFNRVIGRIGGRALTARDVTQREKYLDGLSKPQRDAYDRAHQLWSEFEADSRRIHDYLDAIDRMRTGAAQPPAGGTRPPGARPPKPPKPPAGSGRNKPAPVEPPVAHSGALTSRVLSAWDDFLNLTVRNLSHLRRESPEAHAAALRVGGASSQGTVLLQVAVSRIVKALEGSGISWEDMRRALIESRLRGARERYERFSSQAANAADGEELRDFAQSVLPVLSAIEGRAGLEDTLGQAAVALVENEDWHGLRTLLTESFDTAAQSVGEAMPEAEYRSTTRNENFQDALGLYKSMIERPLAESHSINEGVFSDSLGPLDTYYPLVPVKEDGGILHRIFGVQKVAYRKPRNIANQFATGLADDYSAKMEDFADRVRASIRTNNKAALLSELDRQGLVRVLGRDERAPEELDGFPARVEDAGADLVIIRNGKSVRVPGARVLVPTWLNKEIRPLLEKRRLEPGLGEGLANRVIWASLVGPVDFIWHSTNLAGTLVANTPFVGKTWLGKTVGNLPFTKWATALFRVLAENPLSDENIANLTEMANIGLIPPHYGSKTFSKKYAEATGAKRGFVGAALHGPAGVDIRARLVMWRVAKQINPDATPQQLFDFVSQLGIYNRELESQIERWAKATRLAPFATAGAAMLRNGLNAWIGLIGTQPIPIGGGGAGRGGEPPELPPGDEGIEMEEHPQGSGSYRVKDAGKRFSYRLAQALSGGAAGLILLWALVYKEYKKKYPWQDPEARLLQIPLNPEDKKKFAKLFGSDPTKTAYVNFAFFSPLVPRGARAMGLPGAFETHQLGGTPGQAFEAAQTDILNSFSHPFVSGPVVRTPFVFFTGREPQLQSLRDVTGSFGPQFYPATVKAAPGLPALGRRAEEAALNINPFAQAVGAGLGLGHKGEFATQEGAPSRWVRMITDLAVPRLLGSSVDVEAKRERIAKQGKAATSHPPPDVKMPEDVRTLLRDNRVIPNRPDRRPDETDEQYQKRVSKTNVAVADRVRELVKLPSFQAMDAEHRKAALKEAIKDAREESARGKVPKGEQKLEKDIEHRLSQSDAESQMKESGEYQNLSPEQQSAATRRLSSYLRGRTISNPGPLIRRAIQEAKRARAGEEEE